MVGAAHRRGGDRGAPGCGGRDRPAAGVRSRLGRADPAGAGQGRRADGGRASGHGERGRQAPPAIRAAGPGRHGRLPVPAADAAARPDRRDCRGGHAEGNRRGGGRLDEDHGVRVPPDPGDPLGGRRGHGDAAVGTDPLPVVCPAGRGTSHDRVREHPPVAGRPPGRAVRAGHCDGTRRCDADRLDAAGRPGQAGQRGHRPG